MKRIISCILIVATFAMMLSSCSENDKIVMDGSEWKLFSVLNPDGSEIPNKESIFGELVYKFEANGTVTISDANKSSTGSWVLNETGVSIAMGSGTLNGVIKDDIMTIVASEITMVFKKV